MVGALALWEVPVDSSFTPRLTFIDEVSCGSNEAKLLNCPHYKRGNFWYWCHNGGDAGVRCREEELRVKNISTATIDTPYNNYTKQTVLISWELYSNASHRPGSFRVECSNQQHSMELSVNNGTLMQINIGDLLSSTPFACCVSAIYYEYYETERKCTSMDLEMLPSDLFTTPAPNQTFNQPFTTTSSTQMNSSIILASIGSEKVVSSDLNMRVNIIGGLLGSIIAILLLLLVICGGGLLYLSRSKGVIPKR